MTGIEKRIKVLEGKAGISGEVQFICVKNYLDGNPECPAFNGDTDNRCIRFREFCGKPQTNEKGVAVFRLRCEGCEGVKA